MEMVYCLPLLATDQRNGHSRCRGRMTAVLGSTRTKVKLKVLPTQRVKSLLVLTIATEDVTLTSQTLNADGTPKRPMNAFMIFARRRRPQVSAENQSMRTGEISKLLSKEWTTMPMVSTHRGS
jgi:hypothetical protein